MHDDEIELIEFHLRTAFRLCHKMYEDGNEDDNLDSNVDKPNDINKMFGNSLFGDLANEMANTFNFDEMEAETDNDTGAPDIGKTLGNFMKGDNPAKFMNLINKFGNQLQNDVSSGKVNQNDLLKETSKMMGNLEGSGISSEDIQSQAEKMFGANSPQSNKVKNNMKAQSTRERLQKKLADKNANK